MNPLNVAPAQSVDELLGHHDSRFVACAYLTLLRRPVDDRGLDIYTRHLRAGMSRAEVIASLVQSEEGRTARVDLPGLAEVLAGLQDRPPTLSQRAVRRLTTAALRPIQRQLQRIENELGRTIQENAERQVRLELSLADSVRSTNDIRRTVSELQILQSTAMPQDSDALTRTPPTEARLDEAAIARVRNLLAGDKGTP